MQPDFSPLVDAVRTPVVDAIPYVVFFFVFLVALRLLEQRFGGRRRSRWRGRRHSSWRHGGRSTTAYRPMHDPLPGASRMPDAADQLRTVMGASFKAKRLLNRGESRVLAALEPIVAELAPGWRVMAQVSLGEVLDADSVEAFNTINAKRVDFLLVDADLKPRHAIEYQGQGHHQGAAAARDAVKKEALRRAGIGFVEVMADDTPAELRLAVAKMVGSAAARPFGRAGMAARPAES